MPDRDELAVLLEVAVESQSVVLGLIYTLNLKLENRNATGKNKTQFKEPVVCWIKCRSAHCEARLRGRPPFAPFARAAAALAGDVFRPACLAMALLIQSLVPKTPATRAGT